MGLCSVIVYKLVLVNSQNQKDILVGNQYMDHRANQVHIRKKRQLLLYDILHQDRTVMGCMDLAV